LRCREAPRPLTGKFSRARSVWIPQYAEAGTVRGPSESFSTRPSAIGCGRGEPATKRLGPRPVEPGPAAPGENPTNGFQLATDITSLLAGFGIPGLLWAFLYLLAWEHPRFGESIGFGPRTFWLLVPGGLLASFTAVLPIAPVSSAWLGIDFAGALFPLVVGCLALGRYLPPLARSLERYLLVLLIEGALLFVVVLPTNGPGLAADGRGLRIGGPALEAILVAAGAAAVSLAVGLAALRSTAPAPRRFALLVAITSAVLALTFAGTAAVPNVGIVEAFPYYLLPPLAAGFVAADLAPRVLRGEEAFALPLAFLGSTFGVLLGADLLRQPGLYPGQPGLYTIGGAGILDLVYLSGLLSLAGAFLTFRLRGGSWAPVGAPLAPRRLSPTARLRQGYRYGVQGRLGESLASSAEAAREAAAQARRLLGAPSPADGRPWTGIPVPGWVVSDQANLESVARGGTTDGREGFRAWLTARSLVLVGSSMGRARYGYLSDRIVAFGIDLLLLGAPAVAVFAVLARATPGGLVGVLSSVGFSAAIYGFVAVAFLYFAVSEYAVATTVGKWVCHLWVSDRDVRPVGGLAALVRNVSLVPLLTVEGLGAAILAADLAKGTASGGGVILGVGLPGGLLAVAGIVGFVLVGVCLLGTVALIAMAVTAERQRVGDLWAATWVLREPTPEARTPAPEAPPAGAAGPPPG
jgi:uncharacterized RDD family membrane protein YckC